MRNNRFYIETYGCQMNKADSELIKSILSESGYREVTDQRKADLILLNTCSVRWHAEQRVLGRIEALKQLKYHNPSLILGVVGCMAQRLGRELAEKADLIVGTNGYRKLPQMIAEAQRQPQVYTDVNLKENYGDIRPRREGKVKAWVPIMRGCNNFCSYCIVPYLRGRERSRVHGQIMKEISKLAEQGYKEVTLLGQNVNSYNDGEMNFAGLLKLLSQKVQIPRIRFLTSHPKDLSEEVLAAVEEGENICEHVHLPLQSGSSKILKRMNRGYTADEYLEIVQKAKNTIEELSLSTDIIVGFPGETEADFEETLKLMKEIEFDYAFTYKYSPREGTPACKFKETVPEEEKKHRLEELIFLQRSISSTKNRKLVGTSQRVLIEKKSKKGDLLGRTRTDKPVALKDGFGAASGDLIDVKITGSTSATLIGVKK